MLFAQPASITFSSVSIVALLTQPFRVFKPVALINRSYNVELFFAKVTLEAFFACKFTGLIHKARLHIWLQARFVHTLVTHLTLMIACRGICRQLTFFARAAK